VKYISLFSGIGGFDLGLDQAGMECILQVEQDKFALEVLHRHWPNVPKITDVKEVTVDAIKALGANRDGLLIGGGFPCTGMSIAGKREGFRDPRSGLWMEFHRILSEVRPEYAIIENVPGLFSSAKGRDFAELLNGLETIGYSDIAWRVLDSQHWVPQRRKRVFILARHTPTVSGRCAEILFEQSSLRRDTKEGGQEGQDATGESKENSGGNGQYNAYSVADRIRGTEGVASTLSSQGGGTGAKTGLYHVPDLARTIRPSLEGKNGTNSDGTGNMIVQGTTSTLTQSYYGDRGTSSDAEKLVVSATVTAKWAKQAGGPSGSASQTNNCIQTAGAVRRLTPVECARLQGFPDDWNEEVSDAQRYKQLGNAVTVPVAKWIGERILKCQEK